MVGNIRQKKSRRKKIENVFLWVLAASVIVAIMLIATALGGSQFGMLAFWGIAFIVSMAVLVKSADYFLESAERIGLAIGLSSFVVGVTIVAMGTSLPELLTSLIATMRGATEFAAADVVGSNITNLLLVGGIAAIVARKLKIKFDILKVDIPLLLGATVVLALTLYDGLFTFYEGILCFAIFLIYIAYSLSVKRMKIEDHHRKLKWWVPVMFVGSCIGIYIGSHYTVESVIRLSDLFGFGNTSVIAITAVALGTSLPELFVSIAAVRKGNMEMAVGNIIGSNIFNIGLVMAIPSFLVTLTAPPTVLLGLMLMIGATLVYIFTSMDKEITAFEGAMLVVIYILFIGMMFG
ncbi:calcium/sodium antiporter [Thermoproteota archaeon]